MPAHGDGLIHRYEGHKRKLSQFEEGMISGATSEAGSVEPGIRGLET
jgi:hypothetical protein